MKTRDKYLALHKTYEKRAEKELRKLFRNWALSIKLPNSPLGWANIMDGSFELEDIIKTYSKIYVEIGKRHGVRVGDDINVELKMFTEQAFLEAYDRYVAVYLQQQGMVRIQTIRTSFINHVADMLAEYRMNHIEMFGVEPSSSEITDYLHNQARRKSFYRWQMMRIARTESTAASNLGAKRAAESSGVRLTKTWVSAHDPRTRHKPDDWFDHREMDGKTIKNEEKFIMHGQGIENRLDYPGDPSGHPANIINCRCTLIYKPMKDAQGNGYLNW